MTAALTRVQRRIPVLQVAAVVGVFVYGFQTIPGFGQTVSVDTMLVLAALLGVAALGQTLVVILGGLDLSIPGFILVGAVGSVALGQSMPFGVGVALLVSAAVGVGAVTGWACSRLRLQPLVLTLAVGAIAGGVVIAFTSAGDAPPPPVWLAKVTSPATQSFGVPVPPLALIWALIALAASITLHRTPTGRRLYATGANSEAAALTLVQTDRIWAAVFAVSALCSIVAGVLLAGFVGSGNSHLGDPYLFQGLTAVIVGGTTFFGARGDYTHTVLGALLMTELSTVLIGKGLSEATQQMLFGALILLAVALYGRQARVQDRV
jgi:ribose transport system permease protein